MFLSGATKNSTEYQTHRLMKTNQNNPSISQRLHIGKYSVFLMQIASNFLKFMFNV
jgi:hypothetical protein